MEQLLRVRLWAWPLDFSSSLSSALWNLTWKASFSLELHLKSPCFHFCNISLCPPSFAPCHVSVNFQYFNLVIPLFLFPCHTNLTEDREFCWSPLLSHQCLSVSRYSIKIHGMNEAPMVGPFHK